MAAINERVATPGPRHYLWSFPGSPVKIHLALEVVARLQSQLSGEDGTASWGGLLSGHVDGLATTISDFHPLTGGEAADIQAGLAALSNTAGQDSVVGYYRFQLEEGLRLDPADLSLARAFFPDPHHVILLIQPGESGPPNATFYFWDAGRLNGDFPFLEFPFDAHLLAASEQHRAETAERRTLELVPPAPQPAAPEAPKPHHRSVWKAVVWTSLAVCLAAAAAIGSRYAPDRFFNWFRSASAVAPPPQAAVVSPRLSIDLRAERQNGDLKLTWNREIAVIANATSALLSIEDGASRRNIPLQAAQVRSGSILYTPITDQVQMALTVSAPTEDITESVLVLLPQNGPQRTIPAPRVAAPPESTSRFQPIKPFVPPAPAARRSSPVDMAASSPPLLVPVANSAPAAATVLNRPSASPAPPPAPETSARPATPPPRAAPVYYPPEAVQRVRPVFSAAIKSSLSGPVLVEVTLSIDETGKVVKATPVLRPGVSQALVFASMAAAKEWKFQPARRGDQPVPSEMTLRFNFAP
jgi:periplasmic protein TonB